MKLNQSIDALLLASSLLIASTSQAQVGKVLTKTSPKVDLPPVAVCGVLTSKTYHLATDLFTDCPDRAERCLELLKRKIDPNSNGFQLLPIEEATTQATARECLQNFENELFGEE